ncbi:hypothetical protein CROQUDRAFT_104140 [Cronartium quercuum f. sp. fusiforme G11]|uniref:Uncharacterized protein n=1 Tax=Cronartium quercuum f. sp. fusiforme G11 TaxID=708437 RepID=A0A9P6TFK8_9BASI|nr:hypothetical protein CROQUDRAFT_104140 [Cronartium quercuum f. sp. fusiforme G11]
MSIWNPNSDIKEDHFREFLKTSVSNGLNSLQTIRGEDETKHRRLIKTLTRIQEIIENDPISRTSLSRSEPIQSFEQTSKPLPMAEGVSHSPGSSSDSFDAHSDDKSTEERGKNFQRNLEAPNPFLEVYSSLKKPIDMELPEVIKELAKNIARPLSIDIPRLDTISRRLVRAASWDVLYYLAYFNSVAESELKRLYEDDEEFLTAHVLNLEKRFGSFLPLAPIDNQKSLQEMLAEIRVPESQLDYADFYQFHDRFLKQNPQVEERFREYSQRIKGERTSAHERFVRNPSAFQFI